ncbi:MAG TPA: hypothetical protein VG900_10605 [Hyphomicrobiaceae bacterium]|nr:hypothetical protein [Hyphomicrobiaceae bacterium]
MATDAQNIEQTQRETWYRLLNWTMYVELAKAHFQDVVRQRQKEGYFESLYVSHDENERQIQLFAGAHPVGRPQTVWDSRGRIKSQRLYVEKGAALVMSQSIRGDVAVVLYPYQSEKHRRREEFIVWGVFDNPAHITIARLHRMTRDFFIYIRCSSLYFTPSFLDNLRINWLLLRSRRYDEQGVWRFILSHPALVAVGLLGSIASIWGLVLALR